MSLYEYFVKRKTSRDDLLLFYLINLYPSNFPRYRDVFLVDKDDTNKKSDERVIYIYTRTGGYHRKCYKNQILQIQKHPLYLRDFDDSLDQSYMTFVLRVLPEKETEYDILWNALTKKDKDIINDLLKKISANVNSAQFGK